LITEVKKNRRGRSGQCAVEHASPVVRIDHGGKVDAKLAELLQINLCVTLVIDDNFLAAGQDAGYCIVDLRQNC